MQPTQTNAPTRRKGSGTDSGRSKPARIEYRTGEELIAAHHYRDSHGDWCVHVDEHAGSKDLRITSSAVKHVEDIDAEELAHRRTGFVGVNTANVDEVPTVVARWAAARDVRPDESERSLVSNSDNQGVEASNGYFVGGQGDGRTD